MKHFYTYEIRLDQVLLLTMMDEKILVTMEGSPTLITIEEDLYVRERPVDLESFKKGRRVNNDVNEPPLSPYERDDDGDDVPF